MILTLLCERYIVQAADRRVTYSDGRAGEVMNKIVVIANAGTAAYTGLAFVDGRNPTDMLLLDSIARSFKNRTNAIERLAHQATRAVRMNHALPSSETQRATIARTSFVLGVYERPGESPGPTLIVVSNAQADFSEAWLPMASKKFHAMVGTVPHGSARLHVAGQPLPPVVRKRLTRQTRDLIHRGVGPEAAARLLARAIQDVSSANPSVGSNVTCVLVRNVPAPEPGPEGLAINVMGMVPLGEQATREANFFRAPFGDLQEEQITSIFLPDPNEPQVAYGPSYVSADVQLHSPIAGPDYAFRVAEKAVANLRAGRTIDLRIPEPFRRRREPRILP